MAGKKSFIFIIAFVFLFRNKEVLMARKADIRNSILIPAEICDPCNSHKSLSAFLYAGRLGHCRQDARRKRYNFRFFSYKNNKIRLIRNTPPNQPCFLFLPTPLVQQLPCAVPRLYVPVITVVDELLERLERCPRKRIRKLRLRHIDHQCIKLVSFFEAAHFSEKAARLLCGQIQCFRKLQRPLLRMIQCMKL